MELIVRGAAALGLLTALVAFAGGSSAGADGADAAYVAIDVQVVGTPPADAQITLVHTDGSTVDQFPVALAELGDGPEVADLAVHGIGHGVYVAPDATGGADAIDYTCATSGVDGSTPDPSTRCDELAPSGGLFPVIHAYTQFWGQVSAPVVQERSDVTVTLTYDPPTFCDGQLVTVDLSQGDAPTAGDDVILGTSGIEDLSGRGGNDRICGGGGADVLRGGAGRDRILGGRGADRLEGGDGSDVLLGQGGGDALFGQAGADRLDGGTERDTCNGGPQADTATACEVRTAIP